MAFRHEALLYEGRGGLLPGVREFVEAGLAAGEPVLVAMQDPTPLHQAFGEALEYAAIPSNPARIIPFWRDFVAAHDGPVRGIGEPIWPGRPSDELVECQYHESLLNLAFEDDFALLCPYDVSGLDEAVIHEARRSHPVVDAQPSRAFRDEPLPLAPLPPPPRTARVMGFELESLVDVRRFVEAHGAEPDFVLVVDELAANSIRHGGGRGVVRVWEQDGSLVCDVRDQGSIADPLAGRTRPSDAGFSGRGLWIANALCDLVQIRPGAVRVRSGLARPSR